MDSQLHEAALTGDANWLLRLFEQDSLLLDRAASVDGGTPLHIASLHGHFELAETILCLRPKLASVLDSARQSPLYLASMKGHVGIAKLLLQIDPSVCLIRNQDGMTPLHAAALKGRTEVVKEIMIANRIASLVLSNTREPIMHMCVNHGRFDVVKTLLEFMHDDSEYVLKTDDDDNTILHVTAAKKNIPLTKFLLEKTMMKEEVNTLNVHGLTALDMFLQNRNKSSNDVKLEGILRSHKASKASLMPLPKDSWMVKPSSPKKDRWTKHVQWLNETRSSLMIVAILIATVTYQAVANPPGGVWQEDDKANPPGGGVWQEDDKANPPGGVWQEDDKANPPGGGVWQEDDKANPPGGVWPENDKEMGHSGQSIMAEKNPLGFLMFSIGNSIGFISSLIIILFLISGFPLKRRIFMWALMIITWIAVSCMVLSYYLALFTICSMYVNFIVAILHGFAVLILALPLVHMIRVIVNGCWQLYLMTRRGVISIDM